jgi:hypothetical protein
MTVPIYVLVLGLGALLGWVVTGLGKAVIALIRDTMSQRVKMSQSMTNSVTCHQCGVQVTREKAQAVEVEYQVGASGKASLDDGETKSTRLFYCQAHFRPYEKARYYNHRSISVGAPPAETLRWVTVDPGTGDPEGMTGLRIRNKELAEDLALCTRRRHAAIEELNKRLNEVERLEKVNAGLSEDLERLESRNMELVEQADHGLVEKPPGPPSPPKPPHPRPVG